MTRVTGLVEVQFVLRITGIKFSREGFMSVGILGKGVSFCFAILSSSYESSHCSHCFFSYGPSRG